MNFVLDTIYRFLVSYTLDRTPNKDLLRICAQCWDQPTEEQRCCYRAGELRGDEEWSVGWTDSRKGIRE
jgi:hypothetical protein